MGSRSDTLESTIDKAERHLELWDRVCGELDEGKRWDEIDNGLREGKKLGVEFWEGYMRQRVQFDLRDVVSAYRDHTPTPMGWWKAFCRAVDRYGPF